MKHWIAIATCGLLTCIHSFSQGNNNHVLELDPYDYGVVLDDSRMKTVVVKKDIPYLNDEKGTLHIDLYSPPGLKAKDMRPAIIFLNAIGDDPDGGNLKDWAVYKTWPALIAANGYIGVSMECDRNRIRESIQGLFNFLETKGGFYGIDKDRLGVYALSQCISFL